MKETFLTTQGRQVHVPEAATRAGVCQFSFEDLCDKPLGAADYLAIADAFPVVFVHDVPLLSLNRINQVRTDRLDSALWYIWLTILVQQMRRFITFVDCMYDKGVRVRVTAK